MNTAEGTVQGTLNSTDKSTGQKKAKMTMTGPIMFHRHSAYQIKKWFLYN